MGRPRKRQKTDDDDPPAPVKSAVSPPRPIQPAPDLAQERNFSIDIIDPSLAALDHERTQFENICNAPLAQAIRKSRQAPSQDQHTPLLHSGTSDTSMSQNGAPTPDHFDVLNTQYPTDVAEWPDFSTMDMLPLPLEDKFQGIDAVSNVQFDPDANIDALSNLPSIPACPCLPNLYLTLSTMSSLSSFPFTHQTIETIETAFKTAKGVIYCSVCPQKFDTGSSNLMLACTLLNVLSDQWRRWRNLSVSELRSAFGTAAQQQSHPSTKEGLEWRKFSQQMLRAYGFGDAPIPPLPYSGSTVPAIRSQLPLNRDNVPILSLSALVEALTRRQRQWHRLDEPTDEFPDRITPDLTLGHMVGGDHHGDHGKHLCLEIVNHARCILKRVDEMSRAVEGDVIS